MTEGGFISMTNEIKKNLPPLSSINLSEKTKQIILGSLLGDGSLRIHRGYRNARFSFRHSITQKEYFFWKVRQLKEISSSKCVFVQDSDKDSFSKEKKLRYCSRALLELTQLYYITHKRKKLWIRRKWLNYMDSLGLAIWWFDDGSIISNGRKGVICTDGFERESVKRLIRYLKVVWNIQTKIGKVEKKTKSGKTREYFRIWFRSANELKKFLTIILPHLEVEELLPKVILLYKDSQLQQRWASEIARLTNFDLELINKYIRLKKARWKQFQKKI